MGNNKNEIQDAVLYAVIVWNRSLTPGWLNSCIFRFFSFYRKIQRNTKIPEVIDWSKKSKRQTTLALWKFVVNWDVRFWKGEKKSVEYFSRTFRYLLCKNKLIGNQFFIGIGIPKYACEITVSSKKILKKIFDLRHEKQFERRGVASYEELLILFFDSSFKRPSSCWSQCCHYSSKVCSLYDKPFDALWWCCWLHCY